MLLAAVRMRVFPLFGRRRLGLPVSGDRALRREGVVGRRLGLFDGLGFCSASQC